MIKLGYATRKKLKTISLYLLLVGLSIVVLLPIVSALLTSITPNEQLVEGVLIPTQITFNRFIELFTYSHIEINLVNSLLVASAVSLLTVTISSTSAYGLSRSRSRATTWIRNAIFSAYVVPRVMVAFSLVRVFADFHLINTLHGVVLAHLTTTVPFATLILWPFFDAIPKSLDEAARIDGASRIRTFFSIIMPVALPGVVSLAIFAFLLSWADWTFCFFLLRSRHMYTMSLRISDFMIAEWVSPWDRGLPAATLISLPLIVVFAFLQNRLIKGMGTLR